MRIIVFIITVTLSFSASADVLALLHGEYVSENCHNTSGFRDTIVGGWGSEKTVNYDEHVKKYNGKEYKFVEIAPNEIHIFTKMGDEWGSRPAIIDKINMGVFETSRNDQLEDEMGYPLDTVTKSQASVYFDEKVLMIHKYKGFEGRKELSEIKFQDAHKYSVKSYEVEDSRNLTVKYQNFENPRVVTYNIFTLIISGLAEDKSIDEIKAYMKEYLAQVRKISYTCTYKKLK